jgi:hypothetical protein
MLDSRAALEAWGCRGDPGRGKPSSCPWPSYADNGRASAVNSRTVFASLGPRREARHLPRRDAGAPVGPERQDVPDLHALRHAATSQLHDARAPADHGHARRRRGEEVHRGLWQVSRRLLHLHRRDAQGPARATPPVRPRHPRDAHDPQKTRARVADDAPRCGAGKTTFLLEVPPVHSYTSWPSTNAVCFSPSRNWT